MFKKINLRQFVIVAFAMLTIYSCTDQLTDLNVDPNNPSEVPVENLITQAQQQLNNRMWGRSINAEWGMLMIQHWSQSEYPLESLYIVDSHSFNTDWIELYTDVLIVLTAAQGIIDANENLPTGIRANQTAIITILKEYTFHNLTDMYGALPYSSALDTENNPFPAYDSQSAIYTGIVANLQAAIRNIDLTADGLTSGDAIYSGDMNSWLKFANSLLLRVAMRMVDVNGSAASTVIQGIDASNLITSNGDNAMFVFDANPEIANPLFVDIAINDRDDFRVCDVLINALVDMGDPRLSVYSDTTRNGEYVGLPSGFYNGEILPILKTSGPHPGVRGATSPAIMIDAAEVNFLLAEAYARDIISGDAAAAYDVAVSASMEYWGFSNATAYIAANPYDGGNWKKSIGVQKWLAFYMNGSQAWAEWRRLDYPKLAVPVAARNPTIPVRLPYPTSEEETNGRELGKVTSNPNDLNTKLWWDVN